MHTHSISFRPHLFIYCTVWRFARSHTELITSDCILGQIRNVLSVQKNIYLSLGYIAPGGLFMVKSVANWASVAPDIKHHLF